MICHLFPILLNAQNMNIFIVCVDNLIHDIVVQAVVVVVNAIGCSFSEIFQNCDGLQSSASAAVK